MKGLNALITLALAVAAMSSDAATAAVLAADGGFVCASEAVLSETFIGPNKDVKVTVTRCDDALPAPGAAQDEGAAAPELNVCGAQCTVYCVPPAGGPVRDDCERIADALIYEADPHNSGNYLHVPPYGSPGSRVTMQYGTCSSYFSNISGDNLTYCRLDWADVVNSIASVCDPVHTRGGYCANNKVGWSVGVQRS